MSIISPLDAKLKILKLGINIILNKYFKLGINIYLHIMKQNVKLKYNK